jgi:hypothetical protein
VTVALDPIAQTPFSTICPVEAEAQDDTYRISDFEAPEAALMYTRQPTAPVSAAGLVTVMELVAVLEPTAMVDVEAVSVEISVSPPTLVT